MCLQAGERSVSSSADGGKEMEFIPLRVRGQSFLLHQIRKMIGEDGMFN
jgi:tRNA U38,U39,U40 pseudouridine synthase TruA